MQVHSSLKKIIKKLLNSCALHDNVPQRIWPFLKMYLTITFVFEASE